MKSATTIWSSSDGLGANSSATERRKALISALHMFFGDEIVLDVPLGGMHVIARFVAREDDVAMAARAQRAGLAPLALSLCTAGGSPQSGLLLSFTNIPVEAAEREERNDFIVHSDDMERHYISFAMSALPPKVDIVQHSGTVRFTSGVVDMYRSNRPDGVDCRNSSSNGVNSRARRLSSDGLAYFETFKFRML